MNFIIPKTFRLMCREIVVRMEPDLVHRTDRRGEARYRANEIAIQASTDSYPVPPDHHIETFCHELLHWIFYVMERDDLGEDEKLIEVAARLLAQALLTAEGKAKG